MKRLFLLFIAFLLLVSLAYAEPHTFWSAAFVNTSIVPTTKAGYDYEANQSSGAKVYFKNNINTAESVRFEKDGYYFIYDISGGLMQWRGQGNNTKVWSTLGGGASSSSKNSLISRKDNIATYSNSFFNTTTTYTITDDMLKENFILTGLPSIKDYDYLEYSGNIKFNKSLQICTDLQCYTPSGTADDFETSGKIYFKDMQNNTIFYLVEPTITDTNGNTIKGIYKVHGSDAQMQFWLKIDKKFLQNAVYPVYIDPTVTFSTASITSVATTPLGPDLFVMAYCDDTNDDIHFQVLQTNGTVILAETNADDGTNTGCNYNSVSVSAFNSTDFVISWFDNGATDTTFSIYNSDGTKKAGPIDADTSAGASVAVSVSTFNSTDFVIAWADAGSALMSFAIYNSAGTNKVAKTDVASYSGTSNQVTVSALSDTQFVFGWENSGTILFKIYNSAGTGLTDTITVDSDITSARSISSSTFNNTDFVIGWYDNTDDDTTFAIYNSGGTLKSGPTDADATAGTNTYTNIGLSTFNSTNFVIGWLDGTDSDISFNSYTSASGSVSGLIDTNAVTTLKYVSTAARNQARNISICNNNFVIAYVNSTTNAVWETYNANGTAWDGTCPVAAVSNSCTPPAINTNWAVQASDNCTISNQNINMGTGILSLIGSNGYFQLVQTNITMARRNLACTTCKYIKLWPTREIWQK